MAVRINDDLRTRLDLINTLGRHARDGAQKKSRESPGRGDRGFESACDALEEKVSTGAYRFLIMRRLDDGSTKSLPGTTLTVERRPFWIGSFV